MSARKLLLIALAAFITGVPASAQRATAPKKAAVDAGLPPLGGADAIRQEVSALRQPIFDPAFEPMTTAKTPPAGKDILQVSANTFYQGLTLDELKNFQEHFPLNSRVVKDAKG